MSVFFLSGNFRPKNAKFGAELRGNIYICSIHCRETAVFVRKFPLFALLIFNPRDRCSTSGQIQ